MKTPIVTAVLCLALAAAPAAGQVIYSITYEEGASLVSLEAEGVVVRHVGTSEALIEGDSQLGAALRRRGRIVEEVIDVGRWAELYLCYPAADLEELERAGEILWVEPDGAVLVGASPDVLHEIRRASFMALPLPASIPVAALFDETPPLLASLAAGRDERSVRGLVQDVLEAVSADSLAAQVERLTRYPGGAWRTRYAYREEKNTEAIPYIMDALESCLPAGALVDTQRFELNGFVCGDTTGMIVPYAMHNIVGVLPGTGRLQGYFVVSAHYDATAQRSYPPSDRYWWCDSPAPGADDNATGVATVLEAARVLADVSFPYDIRFILFDAEEPGLFGSEVYAGSAAAEGDTIYGVINVDMVGYNPPGAAQDTCHVLTNPSTKWLASWLVDTAEDEYAEYFPGFGARRIDRIPPYSDHMSFWIEGYDALTALENWHPNYWNPNYHTVADTIAHISLDQLASTAKMVAGAIARLADPDSAINLAVFSEDFRFTPDEFWTNSATTVRVDVHVFGPEEFVDLTLEIWDGPEDEGELLSVFQTERTMGGGEVITYEFDWEFDDDDLGNHEVTARIIAEGVDELTDEDNIAAVAIRVNAPALFVTDHYPYPNPYPGPSGESEELAFGYDLSRDAGSVEIDVFDITGQTLGSFLRYHNPIGSIEENMGTLGGWNSVAWTEFSGSATHLASGVYVYQLRVYDGGGKDPSWLEAGKFAVVR